MVNNRGSALISALFIMTLVAIAGVAMSLRLQLDIHRTQLSITQDKLYLATQAVTFWAMDNVSKPRVSSTYDANVPDRIQTFPKKLEYIYPNVTIQGELYDAQAYFNVNNLRDRRFFLIFFRLLQNTLPNLDTKQRSIVYGSIYYWVNSVEPGLEYDGYSRFYLNHAPAYLPGYQAMQHMSELRLIRAVDPKVYQALLTMTTALPTPTQINLNTAPKTLLMALGNGLTATQVDEILEKRAQKELDKKQTLGKLLHNFRIPPEQVTIESEYYWVKATATTQAMQLTTYTLIQRYKDQQKKIAVRIIRESFHTM